MSKISVVMPVYNAEMYISEAIESILKQSFSDFELIIVDDGSFDKTLSIIRTFNDGRIKVLENRHDFIESLNIGMENASGKYIARMDADDIMYVDRLKIQYSIMETEPDLTVCGTWMTRFGKDLPPGNIAGTQSGLIKKPLLKFLRGNYLFHPTAMIRTSFLRKNNLKYENYLYAEDFKFWTEIAKLGGQFYIENQPLLYYRISNNQVSQQNSKKQQQTTELIITEVLEYLIMKNRYEYPELSVALSALKGIQEKGLIHQQDVSSFFQNVFMKNKNGIVTM